MGNWENEDIEKMRKFVDIQSRGFYCNGSELTALYNKILNKRATPTNCQTCLKGRYAELKRDFDIYMTNLNKPQEEPKTIVRKVGRPKKNA